MIKKIAKGLAPWPFEEMDFKKCSLKLNLVDIPASDLWQSQTKLNYFWTSFWAMCLSLLQEKRLKKGYLQNFTFHAIMSIIYMMKIILVGHIHEGVLHPLWTLSHPDFLNQVVPVSENLQFREKRAPECQNWSIFEF